MSSKKHLRNATARSRVTDAAVLATAQARAVAKEHANGETTRPETPSLEGREPLPPELTGRASGTDENLVALFNDKSAEHLADGFSGGSEDDPEDSALPGDGAREQKTEE